MTSSSDPRRELLRHMVATIAYRGGKAIRGADPEFALFTIGGGTRGAVQILAHINDLLEWSLRLARGERDWRPQAGLDWTAEEKRFYEGLARLDEHLASPAPLEFGIEQLLQGPIADVFTHIGQISMLRRRAGSPVRAEVMILSRIEAGRVGPDQAPPVREFD
jgi:hypothetical protein